MKRSQMISAMIDAAKGLRIELDYTQASAILGRLEHEGMLPPNQESIFDFNNDIITPSEICYWLSETEPKTKS